MSADIAFMPRLSEFKTKKGRASIGAVNGACVCRACGPGDGRECFGQARASAAPVDRATAGNASDRPERLPLLWTGRQPGHECFGQARASAAPVHRATSPSLRTGEESRPRTGEKRRVQAGPSPSRSKRGRDRLHWWGARRQLGKIRALAHNVSGAVPHVAPGARRAPGRTATPRRARTETRFCALRKDDHGSR